MGQMFRPMIDQMMGGSATPPTSFMPQQQQPTPTPAPQPQPQPQPRVQPQPQSQPFNNNPSAASNPYASMMGGNNSPFGGMDINAMMQNPAVQQMANQLLQSGNMNDILSSMGGSGGMPDLNSMMQNPAIQQMASQFMNSNPNMFGNNNPYGGSFGGFGNQSAYQAPQQPAYQAPKPAPQPKPLDDNSINRYKVSNVPQVVKYV